MPVITGLVPSAEQPGHVVILVDGVPFATVPAEAAARLDLSAGASAESAEPLGPLDRATQSTYDRALRVLSYGARSEHELRTRLLDKGEPPAQIEVVLTRLRAHGLLDDAQFAAGRARTGMLGKARSRRRLQQDLAQRGVSREVASAAITKVLADEGTDEAAVAVRAAQKKHRSLTHLPPQEQRHKLYAFLARQGYTPDQVRHALRVVLESPPPEDE
jgi:regulatory protein